MAIEDILPTLIVVFVVYLLVRWLTAKPSAGGDNTSTSTGIRGVTPAMVETVHSAFPHVPAPNIIYHLSRTRSAQATSEEILERGTLPAPPPSFAIPVSLLPATSAPAPGTTAASTNANIKSGNMKTQSLIDRYNLSSRLPSRKGKEKEVTEVSEGAEQTSLDSTAKEVQSGSGAGKGKQDKGKWEDTRDRREMSLKERKEKMILEARKRMLEKQAKEQEQQQAKPVVEVVAV